MKCVLIDIIMISKSALIAMENIVLLLKDVLLVGFPVLTRAYDNNGRCPRQKLVFGILLHVRPFFICCSERPSILALVLQSCCPFTCPSVLLSFNSSFSPVVLPLVLQSCCPLTRPSVLLSFHSSFSPVVLSLGLQSCCPSTRLSVLLSFHFISLDHFCPSVCYAGRPSVYAFVSSF